MKTRVLVFCGIVIACLASVACTLHSLKTYDLVISGGRVIDPETGLDGIRHIGINQNRIDAVSRVPLNGREVINATGLVVSPGFIDLHAHGQNIIGQTYQVRDGVTTALELESGVYPFPNQEQEVQSLSKQLSERGGKSLIHYGYSAGYYGARLRVKGNDQKKLKYETASITEQREILSYVEQQLDKGAIGIGLPLDYMSKGINDDELAGIFYLAARRKVPVFVHIRMSDDASDPSGFEELVALVRKTKASLHMVHLTSTGLGRVPHYIALMDKARADGLDISTEVYPYTANATGINAQILDGDWQTRWGISYQDVEWPPTGKRFTGKPMWNEYRKKYPNGGVIMHSMKEEWVEMAIRHPGIMIISDGNIQSFNQRVHPRVAGTYARVLGRYVRQKKVISLSEAIAKMSYLPAKRLENFTPLMKRKGRIQVGADADITIFDSNEVIDQATFAEPNQFSTGIRHVVVDGQVVVKDEMIRPEVYPGQPISTENLAF